MGIMSPVLRLLLSEHKRQPITGRIALIGRQSVPLTLEQALALIDSEGIATSDHRLDESRDTSTRAAVSRDWISDAALFSLFTDADLVTIDVTDYEAATVVHDMQTPIPEDLAGTFDFVWNGSCLDNIWDPAAAHINSCTLLNDTGRLFSMEMANNRFEAYASFSSAWFYDYYAANRFARYTTYTCTFDDSALWDGPYGLWVPENIQAFSVAFPDSVSGTDAILTVGVAQRDSQSSVDKLPIQMQYRPDGLKYAALAERQLVEGHDLLPVGLAKSKVERVEKSYFGGRWRYLGELPGPVTAPRERGVSRYLARWGLDRTA